VDRNGSFENELRGLAGHREAIRHRLVAVKTIGWIEVPVKVLANGRPLPLLRSDSKPGVFRLTPEQYWRGVPSRFRDVHRFMGSRCTSPM
jgi:hypothetical protein